MTHPYENYTKEELIAVLLDYETSITWDTDCLTCGKLYDKIYELDVIIQKVDELAHSEDETKFERFFEDLDELIEPYIWSKG